LLLLYKNFAPCDLKQACKPNFVLAKNALGNHSSRRFVTELLKRPTRKRRPNCFGLDERATRQKRFSIWSCTARSLPSRACYQTRWRALTASFHTSPFPAVLFSVALVVIRFVRIKCPDVIRLAALRCSDFPLN